MLNSEKLVSLNQFIYLFIYLVIYLFIYLLGFTPCKAKQPLRGMELQEKKYKKDYRIQKICLETTYS